MTLAILFVAYTVIAFGWFTRRSREPDRAVPMVMRFLIAPLIGLSAAATTQFLLMLLAGPL